MGHRRIVVLALTSLVVLLSAAPARPISLPHPEPARRLTVQGFVSGSPANDGRVRFHLVGTDPDGWLHLESLRVALVLHGQPIQEITYTVAEAAVALTGHEPVPSGTRARLRGSFLDVLPASIRLVRQTFSLRVILWATVRADVPADAELSSRQRTPKAGCRWSAGR